MATKSVKKVSKAAAKSKPKAKKHATSKLSNNKKAAKKTASNPKSGAKSVKTKSIKKSAAAAKSSQKKPSNKVKLQKKATNTKIGKSKVPQKLKPLVSKNVSKPTPASVKTKAKEQKPVITKASAQQVKPMPSSERKAQVKNVEATAKVVTPISQPKAKPEVAQKPTVTKAKSATSSVATTSTMGVAPYQRATDEDYMNLHQREHFRKILILWKRQLMEEVDRTVHHMQDDASNFADPNDRATQEEEFSLELRTRDRERKLIKKIDEALKSIDENEYGYCEACGVEIGIQRLEARPTATLCIDCKTIDEIKEKTYS